MCRRRVPSGSCAQGVRRTPYTVPWGGRDRPQQPRSYDADDDDGADDADFQRRLNEWVAVVWPEQSPQSLTELQIAVAECCVDNGYSPDSIGAAVRALVGPRTPVPRTILGQARAAVDVVRTARDDRGEGGEEGRRQWRGALSRNAVTPADPTQSLARPQGAPAVLRRAVGGGHCNRERSAATPRRYASGDAAQTAAAGVRPTDTDRHRRECCSGPPLDADADAVDGSGPVGNFYRPVVRSERVHTADPTPIPRCDR